MVPSERYWQWTPQRTLSTIMFQTHINTHTALHHNTHNIRNIYTHWHTTTTTPDIHRQQAWTCYRTRDWLDMSIILSMCSSPFPVCHLFFFPACSSGLSLFVSFSLSVSLCLSLSLSLFSFLSFSVFFAFVDSVFSQLCIDHFERRKEEKRLILIYHNQRHTQHNKGTNKKKQGREPAKIGITSRRKASTTNIKKKTTTPQGVKYNNICIRMDNAGT